MLVGTFGLSEPFYLLPQYFPQISATRKITSIGLEIPTTCTKIEPMHRWLEIQPIDYLDSIQYVRLVHVRSLKRFYLHVDFAKHPHAPTIPFYTVVFQAGSS